jgi:hypothetical protein
MRSDRSPHNLVSDDEALRPLEVSALAAWILATAYVSTRLVGPRLLLLAIYGWSRVQHDQLSMLRMPKHGQWLVSNGDVVDSATALYYNLLWGSGNFLSIVAAYCLLRVLRRHRLLRAANQPGRMPIRL